MSPAYVPWVLNTTTLIDKSLYIRGKPPARRPEALLEGHARCRGVNEGTRGDAFRVRGARLPRDYIDKYLSMIKRLGLGPRGAPGGRRCALGPQLGGLADAAPRDDVEAGAVIDAFGVGERDLDGGA